MQADRILEGLQRQARKQALVLGVIEASRAAEAAEWLARFRRLIAAAPAAAAQAPELLAVITAVLGEGWERRGRYVRLTGIEDEAFVAAVRKNPASIRALAKRLGVSHTGVRKYIAKKVETNGFEFPPDVGLWLQRQRPGRSTRDVRLVQEISSD